MPRRDLCDGLTALLALRNDLEPGAHVAGDLEEPGASRVDADATDRDARARIDLRGREKERGRGDVAGDGHVERRKLAIPPRRLQLDHRTDGAKRHTERVQHALGVVARERRLLEPRRAMCIEPREKDRALHLRARRRARVLERAELAALR